MPAYLRLLRAEYRAETNGARGRLFLIRAALRVALWDHYDRPRRAYR